MNVQFHFAVVHKALRVLEEALSEHAAGRPDFNAAEAPLALEEAKQALRSLQELVGEIDADTTPRQ